MNNLFKRKINFDNNNHMKIFRSSVSINGMRGVCISLRNTYKHGIKFEAYTTLKITKFNLSRGRSNKILNILKRF